VSDAHKVMTGCVLVELVLVFAGMDRTVTFKSLLWNLFATHRCVIMCWFIYMLMENLNFCTGMYGYGKWWFLAC
jgi:hypothetical protein